MVGRESKNQELVRAFPVAREELKDVPQVEQVDREIAKNINVVSIARKKRDQREGIRRFREMERNVL